MRAVPSNRTVRKPRTKKQKEAFAKAQLALAEKRKVDKEKKEASCQHS
eukprot:SAG22_NODE_13412_length_407_cov_1.870130_1_plen_47_part_10